MTSLLPRSKNTRPPIVLEDVGSPAILQIRRYDSFEDAVPLEENWDMLAKDCGGDVFNTFGWCSIWWRHFGHRRTLAAYVAFRGETLVAAWPLFRETLRWGPLRLRVIRIVGCDHGVTTCNVLTRPEWVGVVAPAMLDAIESDGGWDLLHFGELPGYATNVLPLAHALRTSPNAGGVRVDDDAYPQAVFEVPVQYDDYLASLSLKERRNVRRDDRELASMGAMTREPRSLAELAQAFDQLVKLHSAHWRKRGRGGHFEEFPGVEMFYRELANHARTCGRMALTEIIKDQSVLASEFALRFNNRVHWIIGGRRETVTSRAGFGALMRTAIHNSAALIDALPGEYDYKRRLGARTLGVKMIWILPRGGRGSLRLALTRAIMQAISLAYHRAWFWHLAPWCRTRMPHLSERLVRPSLWERFARSRFLVVSRRKCGRVRDNSTESK